MSGVLSVSFFHFIDHLVNVSGPINLLKPCFRHDIYRLFQLPEITFFLFAS